MMRVLFLDVDGVLNPHGAGWQMGRGPMHLVPELCERLERVLAATGAVIVLARWAARRARRSADRVAHGGVTPVLNQHGVINFTEGREGCTYGGAPLRVCPQCKKLGRPKTLAKTIRFEHSGRIEINAIGEAEAFQVGRFCVVKREDV